MNTTPTPRLSTSTWSLHRALGVTYPDTPEREGPRRAQLTYGAGEISLLQAPERVAALGIRTLEICHFHIPVRDPGYLTEVRAALAVAGVELFSLLIDAGDITHPEHHERDLNWIGGWVDTAGALGARCTRVIAGKSEPDPDSLSLSAAGLRKLSQRAVDVGVRLMTENWFALLARPAEVHELLERLEGSVGLCLDFGNWAGPSKYENLAAIAHYAESCHAKARFTAPRDMDADDYRRCLELTRATSFAGPYTLIYDGPGDDEWAGLTAEREVVREFLN